MTSKANLSTRAQKAREASRFVGQIRNGSNEERFSVPGSSGQQYNTKIRKVQNSQSKGYISVQCWNGQGDCKGNSNGQYPTVCYHGLASVEFMARQASQTIAWCANRPDAVRLSTLGGTVFKVVSHQSDGVVFGVARGK